MLAVVPKELAELSADLLVDLIALFLSDPKNLLAAHIRGSVEEVPAAVEPSAHDPISDIEIEPLLLQRLY